MEKLSRVKKYEELRKSIEVDNNINNSIQTSPVGEQEEALKKFNSSVFKKVEIQGDVSYTPEREKDVVRNEEFKSLAEDSFTNEYLDDFIKEVRDYNIKKGNREIENTQADILYQLNSSNRKKRSQYLQDIQENTEQEEESKKMVLSKDAIALEVANLLQEDIEGDAVTEDTYTEDGEMITELLAEEEDNGNKTMEIHLSSQPNFGISANEETEEKELEEIVQANMDEQIQKAVHKKIEIPQKKAKKVIQPIVDNELEDIELPMKKNSKDRRLQSKLLEETQQLRVQMDEYEDNLTDLSEGVEKTNKLLNFLLCFLILALLIVIGVIVYQLWNKGGL